ncbi:thioredoxin family protein [Undibacterium sp. Ren11W]|uniref:thioredoxin family protein n=1 Tax=Undibacterium sp. Ren11W TaxID=3413045 RepID=UPI003BF34F60
MKKLFASLLILLCSYSYATVAPAYLETADAQADLNHALSQAQASKKKVLIVFGANWCKDCLELDKSFKAENAALIASQFVLVKIDVGQFDKNLTIANAYGNPIKKGIPAAVILRADNTLLYASKGGELSNARRMGDAGIAQFFQQILSQHP